MNDLAVPTVLIGITLAVYFPNPERVTDLALPVLSTWPPSVLIPHVSWPRPVFLQVLQQSVSGFGCRNVTNPTPLIIRVLQSLMRGTGPLLSVSVTGHLLLHHVYWPYFASLGFLYSGASDIVQPATTLQRKSHLCIPFLGITRAASVPISTFICLWVIYKFTGSVHIFPAAE